MPLREARERLHVLSCRRPWPQLLRRTPLPEVPAADVPPSGRLVAVGRRRRRRRAAGRRRRGAAAAAGRGAAGAAGAVAARGVLDEGAAPAGRAGGLRHGTRQQVRLLLLLLSPEEAGGGGSGMCHGPRPQPGLDAIRALCSAGGVPRAYGLLIIGPAGGAQRRTLGGARRAAAGGCGSCARARACGASATCGCLASRRRPSGRSPPPSACAGARS